jgi:hypothetical protein
MSLFKAILLSSVSVIAVLTIGCSSPDNSSIGPQNQLAATIEKEKYIYFDKTYEVEYNVVGDSVKKIDSPDNAAVAELMSNPSAGLVKDPKEENVFWIYKDRSEQIKVVNLIKAKSNLPQKLAKTKYSGAYANLYYNSNYDAYAYRITGSESYVGDQYNDEISSLYTHDANIALYEHGNYGGHSITFVCDGWRWFEFEIEWHRSAQIPNLSNYTMISRWYWGDISWNDQVSSIAIWPY